jgi:transcription antitermination factor NusG
MRDQDWFILRTAGRSTLTLARTLNEDGFEAWTPTREETIRVPRMNVRRKIHLPMLPSFVFVRGKHLVDMLDLAKKPLQSRHKGFSVFHYLDQIPMVSDLHLEPLRTKESEAVPRKSRPSFQKGDPVRVAKGAFQGLFGRVERCKSGYALVIFDDWRRPVQMPTFLLRSGTEESVRKAA